MSLQLNVSGGWSYLSDPADTGYKICSVAVFYVVPTDIVFSNS
jgi:hypothetical protein